MTPPLPAAAPCVLCAQPRIRPRRYCKLHYAAYQHGLLAARRLTAPRQGARVMHLLPRVCITLDGGRRRVVPLRFPERWQALLRYYAATGWTVTAASRQGATLQREAGE